MTISKLNILLGRGIDTNSGLGGGQVQIGTFLYCKYERGKNESNLYSLC